MAVKFTNAPDFCAELRKSDVADGIVRVVYHEEPERVTGGVTFNLFVLATFLAKRESGSEIVRLRHFCGAMWRMGRDEETVGRAEEARGQVETAARELDLELRGGVIEV